MPKILTVLAGCSLIAGLLAVPPAGAQPRAADHPAATTPPAATGQLPGTFQPIAPVRVLDTRSGLGGHAGLVAPGRSVPVQLAASRPVPGDAVSAAVIDVTVPGDAPDGSLSVFPTGTTWDRRVSVSLIGGGTIQRQLTVRLGPDGAVTIRNNGPRALQLMVEVSGFYLAGTPTQPGTFAALNSRVLDTRGGHPLAPDGRLTVALNGRGGIPAGGASAVGLTIAVLSARATGLLTIRDGDGNLATVHLRFLGNPTRPQTMQTQRVVNLGDDGTLTFTQSSSSGVHLVLDLAGYFLPGPGTVEGGPKAGFPAGGYVAISPRPMRYGARTSPGTALLLRGREPLTLQVVAPMPLAYNVVTSSDRPGQPAALALYDPQSRWNGSPEVSSSPALQPTELSVHASAGNTVTVRNLYDAPQTWLHVYLTGYYWNPAVEAS